MKKNINKYIIVVLLIAIVIIPIGKYLAPGNSEINKTGNIVGLTDFENPLDSALYEMYGEDYKVIVENSNVSKTLAENIEKSFAKSELGETIYPNYFGGMYINSEGKLVVQLVESNNQNNLLMDNMSLTSNNNQIIKKVSTSYNELKNVNNIIVDYFTINGTDSVEGFLANYIDIKANKVVVTLENLSANTINTFKQKVLNSNLIKFEQGEEIVNTASTINAGGNAGDVVGIGVAGNVTPSKKMIVSKMNIINSQWGLTQY